MRHILLSITFTLLYIVTAIGQDCDLSSSMITFENSDKTILTTFLLNETFIAVNTSENNAQQSAIVVVDSTNVILSIAFANDTDCTNNYILPGQMFPDIDSHQYYNVIELNWDSLEVTLAINQSVDSLAGCFALSNALRVNDIKVENFNQIANVQGNLNPLHLNISGGVATLNDITVTGSTRALDVCLIDTLNRAFNVFGDFGEDFAWVVTSRMGEVIDITDTPIFNFSEYALKVESNNILHELEIYYISSSGGGDWLTIGNNIKSDLCGSPTRNQPARFDINLVDCEDTCSDGFLNGQEIIRDVCESDTTIVCNIMDIDNVTCFGFGDGAATVEVTSGVGPFTYAWGTGDTTATIQNLEPGTYRVTVTSETGAVTECIAAINQPDSLEVNISLTFSTSCSASAVVTGGLDPYTYEWSTGETFITITEIDTLHIVTVTDRNGCTASASISPEMLSVTCGNCDDGIMNNNETGIDCGGDCDTCPVDSINMDPLQLTKTAIFTDENDNGFAEIGETINYIFSVCNAGTTQLTQVTIEDPLVTVLGGPVIIEAGACDANAFTGTYTITEEDLTAGMVMNQATAAGMLSDTIMVSDLSDDPNNQDNTDANEDGEPDDPTITELQDVGECGVENIDTDDDGICDVLDPDDDQDGVNDEDDAFPLDPFESADTDNDGFGNNADADDDNDGVDDRIDAFPLDPNESIDTDGDGVGNVVDNNDDGDACDDIVDTDPLVASDDCLLDIECNVNFETDSLLVFGGNVTTDIGVPVDSVIVNVTRVGDNVRLLSDAKGDYNSSTLPTLFNYQIRPEKRDLPFLGTSTLDMLFAQRHILRLDTLDTPYKVIAADVSSNQEVSIVDIIVMRRMILGIVDEWNDGVEWKFVDANASFFDPAKPWPFNHVIELENATSSNCNNDFIGIKIGDVDNSYKSSETRQDDVQVLQYSTSLTENGSSVYAFSLEESSDVFGFQISLADIETDGLSVQSDVIDIEEDHYYVDNGKLALSWTNPYGQRIDASDILFTIEFPQIQKDISIKYNRMHPEIYTGININSKTLVLEEIYTTNHDQFSISPNPFSDHLFFDLNLDKTSTVKLNIVNANGQNIWQLTDQLQSGTHQIKAPMTRLDQQGIYFYSIVINGQNHSGKLVRY